MTSNTIDGTGLRADLVGEGVRVLAGLLAEPGGVLARAARYALVVLVP
ncbi:hypothetical protein [Verrucosispora sp. TAA-831]